MHELLSLRAYARSRRERGLPGGTLQAVRKALQRGRISAVGGKIDPTRADVDWLRNTPPKPRRMVDPPRDERLLASLRESARRLGYSAPAIGQMLEALRDVLQRV
ncbi:MAG: hypothetical protein ACM3S5_10340 [Rhodospirillales bacterium]